jgi:hypothetical protein
MHMRTSIATLLVASAIGIFTVAVAQATSTQVNVRIEGQSETLFEGPIWTEGHDVEASSDTKPRQCDGINSLDPQNKTPGPTPTAASVDAMSLIGETFDGQWYPGYSDYFITRWGPDREEEGMSWGVLVNNVFTNVGGCQYELGTGDEVLWAYNAFGHKPFLALFAAAAGYTTGARPLTATAELNKPFEVEVVSYDDDAEDKPPAIPERSGSSLYGGAAVSPVLTSLKGFEKVETESPQTVRTNSNGKASITFTQPGWHRIKATAVNGKGEEDAIRSNRLDVCVPIEGQGGCGSPPGEDQLRTPLHTEEERKHEEETKHQDEARRREEETTRAEEAKHEEETTHAEEVERREEEVKRLEGETKPSVGQEAKSESVDKQSPSTVIGTPLTTAKLTGSSATTGKERRIAKENSRVRCVRGHERRTPSHRSAPRTCEKTVKASRPKPKPKRRPKPQRQAR